MGQVLLLLVVALTVVAVLFGVAVLVTGNDPGLDPVEPDGRAIPLPGNRPLAESDVTEVRFDVALRGYRMAQVDRALRRAAYDIGYKDELIGVLEAEIAALRQGRANEAEALRRAREAAAVPAGAPVGAAGPIAAGGGPVPIAATPPATAQPPAGQDSSKEPTEPQRTSAEPTDPVLDPDRDGTPVGPTERAADPAETEPGSSPDAAPARPGLARPDTDAAGSGADPAHPDTDAARGGADPADRSDRP